MADRTPNIKMLANVVHDVLNATSYQQRDDLVEAVKWRAAALKLPYDSTSVDAAVRMVEGAGRRRDLAWLRLSAEPAPVDERATLDTRPISHDEAADLLARLRRKLGTDDPAPTPMPAATTPTTVQGALRTIHRRDQRKAIAMVAQEILETAERVSALEAAIEPQTEGARTDGDDTKDAARS